MNFIKRVFEGKSDEGIHLQFQKFSRGEFRNRALIKARRTGEKYTIITTAEFANEMVKIVAHELGSNKRNVSGAIVSTNVSSAGDLDAIVSYLPATNLSEGLHNVAINVTDNAGRKSSVLWEFNISVNPLFDFQIYSPMNVIYNDRKIAFNISASEKVDFMEYKNLNDRNPKWKKLCSDCEKYGFSHKRTKIFSDGGHNLSIRATDYYGQVKEENFSIFIDSKNPKLSKTEPRKNAITNGSDFYIKFQEENPTNLTLYFNETYDVDLENECNFDGRYYECNLEINLTDYDGDEIEYWANLTDIAGNSDESKLTNVKVDTTSPMWNDFNFTVDGRRGEFFFNVTEENFDEINYIDFSDSRPKEKRLCSRLKDGVCEKKKSFSSGNHNLTITILDEAGNSYRETDFNFVV